MNNMTNTLPNNYSLNARYTILQQIGQGGFGITYKALDTLFDRVVCIKELFISGNSRREESWSVSSQAVGHIDFAYFKNKFLDEAKKLANFDHPNIVKVLEYFEANNTAYMVMEFVEGKNLKDYVVERNRLNEQEALSLFTQLLDATKAIHSKNYLHRDIKPDNVLITPENKAVLIDFGTAKFHDEKSDNSHTSTLILLSHGYAPPEQYSNQNKKDKYTDIYALGATLYFMLTGEKPLQATDRTINELKSISSYYPEVSELIERAVGKAMELNPSNRFQDVEAFERAMRNRSEKRKPDLNSSSSTARSIPKTILIVTTGVLTIGLLIFVSYLIIPTNKNLDVHQNDTEIPQWKIDFQENWQLALTDESGKSPNENIEIYKSIYANLPDEAKTEREQVKKKIDNLQVLIEKQPEWQQNFYSKWILLNNSEHEKISDENYADYYALLKLLPEDDSKEKKLINEKLDKFEKLSNNEIRFSRKVKKITTSFYGIKENIYQHPQQGTFYRYTVKDFSYHVHGENKIQKSIEFYDTIYGKPVRILKKNELVQIIDNHDIHFFDFYKAIIHSIVYYDIEGWNCRRYNDIFVNDNILLLHTPGECHWDFIHNGKVKWASFRVIESNGEYQLIECGYDTCVGLTGKLIGSSKEISITWIKIKLQDGSVGFLKFDNSMQLIDYLEVH